MREIFNLAANGITEGAKPVLGFNFGAGEYDRVKKGIKVTCTMVLGYMIVAWSLVHFFPGFFVGLFTSEKALAEVAVPALKLFFAGFFMMGFMFCGQSTFVGLGFPKQAIFFSLLRKVVIVVPLTVILPYFMGVNGVFIAEPISNYIGGIASFTNDACNRNADNSQEKKQKKRRLNKRKITKRKKVMSENQLEKNEITEGVIWKQLLIFFFPIMLGMLVQQLYTTIDTIIVGRFVGKEALASVGGPAAVLANIVVTFFNGTCKWSGRYHCSVLWGKGQRKTSYGTAHGIYFFNRS